MGCLCRCDDFLIRGIQSSVSDILHDSALEQPCILKHHAKYIPELTSVEILYIVSIQKYSTAIHVVESHEQLDHGGLARSGRSDYSYLLSRFYMG